MVDLPSSSNNVDQENIPSSAAVRTMTGGVVEGVGGGGLPGGPPRVDPRLTRRQQQGTDGVTAAVGGASAGTVSRQPENQPEIPIPATAFYNYLVNNRIHVMMITELKVKPVAKDPLTPNPSLGQCGFNSIDISLEGDIAAGSTGDGQMVVINLRDPKHKTIFPVAKYGANHLHILPNSKLMVHSSTRTNNDLRLMSFERSLIPGMNEYIRYFRGHKGEVCSLSVSADGRNIISATAIEKKVLLWDVLVDQPIGAMDFSSYTPIMRTYPPNFFGEDITVKPRFLAAPQPVVAFDSGYSVSSTIFAVMLRAQGEILKLYDMRTFQKGPFKSVTHKMFDDMVENFPTAESKDLRMTAITALGADFNDMKFSPDGKLMLLNTNGPFFFILDAFTGELVQVIGRRHREYNNSWKDIMSNTVMPEVSWSSDSRFVVGGNSAGNDPRIYVWSVDNGKEVGIINKEARSEVSNANFAVNFVRCNPRMVGIVAAGGRRISLYSVLADDSDKKKMKKQNSTEDAEALPESVPS